MSKKIAINGFGRIGRLFARVVLEKFPELEIVAVNDITSSDNLAYLLSHDTTYRKFVYPVKVDGDYLVVSKPDGDNRIRVFAEREPENLPWKDLGVDLVVESTGIFTNSELASKHLKAGSDKVLISAPAKSDDIPTIVLGVNPIPQDAKIISNASCTTNCISPVIKVLSDNFNIEAVNALTVHAFTATQVLQDGPSKKAFRDGRSATVNIIPSTSGAAKAVELTIPKLKGKLAISAVRVPVITGSLTNLVVVLDKEVSKEEVNQVLEKASNSQLKGILEYSNEDLVSGDIIANPHSSIVDSSLTEVLGKTVKLVLWYDNEWGYANRLAEVASQF